MRTIVRAVIALAVVVWLGGLLFFPLVAQTVFSTLSDKHSAGLIVGSCLRSLHYEGLACGALLLIVLGLLQIRGTLRRSLLPALLLFTVMLALTGFSQFSIIPAMDVYRDAGGGNISVLSPTDANAVGFERLHKESVIVEEGVMLAGLLLVLALAWADSGGANPGPVVQTDEPSLSAERSATSRR